jgi:sulfate adenylyltransferase large subunit
MSTERTNHTTELLRFVTAGSVDDGKSTLIGRLLYDSKQIFEDQLEALERSSDLTGGGRINLANLTDGLRAEREQGITIDVAYRYFATPNRKFIVADSPGHVQYTRNMVTGASTANLMIVLVDARQGIIEQTRRHAYIASLLRIPHLVLCINKMDLVDYSEDIFNKISEDFARFATRLDIRDISFIPVSALNGDNLVDPSTHMPWHKGPPLLRHLEEVYIASDRNLTDARFPVQYIIRPYSDEHHDFRGYAGQIASGVFRVGDDVIALPSGRTSRITGIHTLDGAREIAYAPMSVALLLADDVDISRGDMLVKPDNLPCVGQDIEANVCWMSERPLQLNGKYAIKHATRNTRAIVRLLRHRTNIDTLEPENAATLGLNDIGRIRLTTLAPLAYDSYRRNRQTGGFILVDEATNETVAAGLILEPPPTTPHPTNDGGYTI